MVKRRRSARALRYELLNKLPTDEEIPQEHQATLERSNNMNHRTQIDKSIKDHRKPARFAFLAALLLTTTISGAQIAVSADQNEQVQPQLALSALKDARQRPLWEIRGAA
jgi:hypothetical protein